VCVLHWTSLPLCGTGTPEKALVDDGHRLGWVGLVFDGQLGPRPDRSVITWYSVRLALPRIHNIASPTYLTTSIFHIYNSSCPVSRWHLEHRHKLGVQLASRHILHRNNPATANRAAPKRAGPVPHAAQAEISMLAILKGPDTRG
jgi:hypothetical protein